MRERMLRLGVAVLVLGLALGGVLGAQQAVRILGTNAAGQSVPVNVDTSGNFMVTLGVGGYAFEGATADDYETTLAVVDPTADRTITFQNADGTVAFVDAPIFTTSATVGAIATQDIIKLLPVTDNDRFTAIITVADLTSADKTFTLPDLSGTFALTGATQAVTFGTVIGTAVTSGLIATQDVIKLLPVTDDDRFTATLTVADLSEDRTLTLPNLAGTLVVTGASQAVSFAGITGTTYTVGAAAGVDCTSAANVTVAKGIVTACTAPDPDMTPAALLAQIQALSARLAALEAQLGRQ